MHPPLYPLPIHLGIRKIPLVGMPTNAQVALAALLEQIERQYIHRPAAMSSVPPISTWPSDVQIAIGSCSIGSIIDDAIHNAMSRAKALWSKHKIADVLGMAESAGFLRKLFKPSSPILQGSFCCHTSVHWSRVHVEPLSL